ncbi:hypothetical protein [Arthrobacter psychrolactophilus]
MVTPGQIAGSVAEFASAVRMDIVPTGQRVRIDDVLTAAYAQALENEKNDDVKAVLSGWGSPLGNFSGLADAGSS